MKVKIRRRRATQRSEANPPSPLGCGGKPPSPTSLLLGVSLWIRRRCRFLDPAAWRSQRGSRGVLKPALSPVVVKPMNGLVRSRRGFSLLELMIAVVLLVVGVASAAYILSRGVFAALDSEEFEQGVALAQERMEQLRGTAFAAIVSQARAPVAGWTGFDRQVTVSTPAAIPNGPPPPDDPDGPPSQALLKQVVVTVFWKTSGVDTSTRMTTYIINNA